MQFILRYQWKRLAYLTAFFIVLNISVIYFFSIEVSRIIRWFSLLLLILFLFHHRGHSEMPVFFILLLLLIRDGCIIQYEVPFFKTLSFSLTCIAYGWMIHLIRRKLKLSIANPVLLVFAIVMIGLNAFNLYYLSDAIWNGLDNNLQFGLFFMQGVMLILLGLAAFVYNDRYTGASPLLFLYFSFSLILCDLAGLAAYFFKWEIAYFPERIFYILSIALLVNYAIGIQKSERESVFFAT